MKKILFVSPQYMDLYKDIIEEMEKQGYAVDFIAERTFKDDPDNIRGYSRFSTKFTNEKKFNKKIEQIWVKKLNCQEFQKKYDFVLVLDGQSISPIFFKVLKERNPNVRFVNYLFDTTTGVYHFEKNFRYFDKVFTFDISESRKYDVGFLPIYWKECLDVDAPAYNIFGLGAIKDDRYELFKKVELIAKKNGLSCYLKLFNFIKTKNINAYKLRYFVYKLMRMKGLVSPKAVQSSYATRKTLSPSEFRKYIVGADIVIDTSAPFQDGLTARFMWSIGLGKKIITSNINVMQYDFFDKNQIFVYRKGVLDDEIENFIKADCVINEKQKDLLLKYRIDYWLKTLLE